MEKRSLLKKYEIPISHLDFDYVKNCKDTKELERIVTILRSGEEGYYPDLTKSAEDKLRELKPQSRVLRTEERILTKNCLSAEEWEEHSVPIIEWSTEIKNKDTLLSTIQENTEKAVEIELPPIRKGGKVTSKKEKAVNPPTPATPSGGPANRVASTNYREWDKYDADAELLKMDLEEERVKEHVERMNRINQEKSAKIQVLGEKKSNIYEKLTPIEREKLSEDYKIRGNECFKSKEYTNALEHYSRCIQILPTLAGYNNRAITNLRLLKYKNALSDCDECLKLDPKNLKALLRKADACLGLDRKLDAFQTYEQVKLIEPDNALACKALESLRSELGEVAPSHATRIKIVEGDDKKVKVAEELKSKPPEKPKPSQKPSVDYDLAELIKPNKMVKSKLMKTMESLGKIAPNKEERANASASDKCKKPQIQDSTSEIKLLIEDPANRVQEGKCLIQEL